MKSFNGRQFIYSLIISQGLAGALVVVCALLDWRELAPIALGLVAATTVAIIVALLVALYRQK